MGFTEAQARTALAHTKQDVTRAINYCLANFSSSSADRSLFFCFWIVYIYIHFFVRVLFFAAIFILCLIVFYRHIVHILHFFSFFLCRPPAPPSQKQQRGGGQPEGGWGLLARARNTTSIIYTCTCTCTHTSMHPNTSTTYTH